MVYGQQIKKHTETNGCPSKGTRKAANALEHVFNPPLQQPNKLEIPGTRKLPTKDQHRWFWGSICHVRLKFVDGSS